MTQEAKLYDVYRQWRPLEVQPADPRTKQDPVYRAVITHEGQIRTTSEARAIAAARELLGLFNPLVQLAKEAA